VSALTRFEALLSAHRLQNEWADLDAEKANASTERDRFEKYRCTVTDKGAHRCGLCGGWLYSVRPCRTPGCADG
jgi:hypothetical protein